MSDDLKCLRCGQDGHWAEDCKKVPVLPDNRVLGPATSPAPNSQPAEEQLDAKEQP
jgi:hypothetical protein